MTFLHEPNQEAAHALATANRKKLPALAVGNEAVISHVGQNPLALGGGSIHSRLGYRGWQSQDIVSSAAHSAHLHSAQHHEILKFTPGDAAVKSMRAGSQAIVLRFADELCRP